MKPRKCAGVVATFLVLTACILNLPVARGEAGTRSKRIQVLANLANLHGVEVELYNHNGWLGNEQKNKEPDPELCPKPSQSAPPVRLLIVTGGHEYEPSEFFAAFNAMPNVRYQHVLMMEGKPVAVPVGGLGQYDVVLFYDMEPKTITPEWRSLLERGKGFVFLHHALGSFPESPEFKAIVGGHANFSEGPQPGVPSSSFHENQQQHYSIIDRQHPATCGISDFDMTDEAYDNIDIDPAAHVLMNSDFPKLSHAVAWTWSYAQKRVLYLEPGHGSLGLPADHGPTPYQNEAFRRVLNRGILWAAGRF